MIKLILAALAVPAIASAQTGLLVVGHGAGPAWNARVRATVAQVRWDGPVATAFLMGPEAGSAGWEAAVAELVNSGARSVVVVPLMISSCGDHYRQVLFYAGALSEMPAELTGHTHGRPASHPPIPFRVTGALDDAAELGDALAEVWDSLPAG
ncbi:MAG: CbiX/SirB N-terminal domain-containing protein, partial [Gemmatimonadota bacterium]